MLAIYERLLTVLRCKLLHHFPVVVNAVINAHKRHLGRARFFKHVTVTGEHVAVVDFNVDGNVRYGLA